MDAVLADGGTAPDLGGDVGSPPEGDACVARPWYADGDGDGFGEPLVAVSSCDRPTGFVDRAGDCDDGCATCNPDHAEVCDGIRDDNCAGGVDEGCTCTTGETRACPGGVETGECVAGTQSCAAGTWGACSGGVSPVPEVCNGLDDDCDGMPDDGVTSAFYQDADMDGFGNVGVTMSACAPPAGFVAIAGDCDDSCNECRPGAAEVCDPAMRDESCDGAANEGCECLEGDVRLCGGGPINIPPAICTFGRQRCSAGHYGVCEGSIEPRAEVCNAFDDDCDGMLDEDPGAGTSCIAPGATTACMSGACVITACSTGLADCDRDPATGCEVDTRLSVAHCGACGNACEAGEMCANGICDPVIGISAGVTHTCAVRQSGRIVCWGSNGSGELGNGMSGSGMMSATPVQVTGISDFVEVALGASSFGRRSSGQVMAWGGNSFGALGTGGSEPSSVPVPVMGISDAVEIDAGYDLLAGGHACARRASGQIACWGFNRHGQLGNGSGGSGMYSATPVTVSGITTAAALGIGGQHSCARLTDSTLRCWGENGGGQLGIGTTMDSFIPVIAGLTSVAGIDAAGDETCAWTALGAPRCWGYNFSGQVGDGTTMDRSSPVALSVLSSVAEIAVGQAHACARTASGQVYCWGDGQFGQLGDGRSGTGVTSTMPVAIPGLTDASIITAGTFHSCAVRRTGAVVCWGQNGWGQLGNGAGGTGMISAIPVVVVGIP